jgi:hypothetical protein
LETAEKGDDTEWSPERDMAFFTEGEVNEIAVNPPECNFFHNEAASCRRESVALIIIAGIFS